MISRLATRIRNSIWNVPVGLQLSLIYTLLLTATLALLGWALYTQLNAFLVQDTAERLHNLTDPILSRPLPPRTPPDQIPSYLVQTLGESGIDATVLDAQGHVISSSQSSSTNDQTNAPALPQDWVERVANGASLQWIVNNPGGDRQLVILRPIDVRSFPDRSEQRLYLLEVTSLGAADDVLNQLRLYIALGIVLGTVIFLVAGVALTRLILRPLGRMARTAQAIAAGDLNRRLRLPSGRNEIARLGSAFDHMVERLASALEAQRRFVADASHELRTPLTSLEGLSEMLLMGADHGDTSVIQRSVRAMYRELARLGRLVADLLTLSRLDSTSPMVMMPLDVSKLAAEVADQMRPLAEAKQIRLVTEITQPVEIQGEPDKLKQVMLNLVDNALRYTPEGGEVRISTNRDPSAQASSHAEGGSASHSGRPLDRTSHPYGTERVPVAQIAVADTGPGIAPQDQAHIFDRFYRADPSRARSNGNTGLGLAIARAIVVAHGGSIGVQSRPGMGARFTITLPALPPRENVPQADPAEIGARG